MKKAEIQAVIFDMDGTMVDNMMIHHQAWQKILEENGLKLSLEEVKENIHGINEEILARLFGDRFSPAEVKQVSAEKERRYREIFADQLQLIPGLVDFIENLKTAGIPMAIASAAPQENVDFVLDGLNLRDDFPVILHASHVDSGKPHPEIYLKTADQLAIEPSACLVFEDSPTGAKSASAARCQVAVVTTTHEPSEFQDIDGIGNFIPDFQGVNLAYFQRGK